MKAKRIRKLIIILLPFIIAGLIMTPRLLSPHFGLMDDGLMYVEVQKILNGDLKMSYDLQAGRFRPFYWLYFTLIFYLAGPNPFWFFIGHLILFLILLVETRLLMRKMDAKDWQILLTSLVFIFSVPIIENFYTLSKGDPLSLVFILASILFGEKIKGSKTAPSHILFAILTILCGLSGIWAKETAYIMAPISALWAGYTLWQRKHLSKREWRGYLIYFICIIASMAAFFLIRSLWGAPSISEGTFTERYSLTLASILERIPRWFNLFFNYIPHLLPFSLIAVVILISGIKIHINHKFALYRWGVWVLLWIAVLLPWEYASAYYLLSISLGGAVLIGLLAPQLVEAINHSRKTIRWLTRSLAVISVLFFLISLTHYRTHAYTQLTIDRVNHQMLAFIEDVTPEHAPVFPVMETRKEYVEMIEYFLVDYYDRDDIFYSHLSMDILEKMHYRKNVIVMMPLVSNQPKLLVRMGVEEEYTNKWNEIVLRIQGDRFTPLKKFKGEFRIFNINLSSSACPLLGERGYCIDPDPLLDTRLFSYGWQIYKLN